MVFSSSIFLFVFLPLTLLLYYITPRNITVKNVILLVFSLIFYAWGEPKYIILMIVSIILNYLFGLCIHKRHLQGQKGVGILVFSVLLNIGLLFYFKYFNLLADTAQLLLNLDWDIKQIALPIGISFFTFQGLSYVIDVYREDVSSPETTVVQKSLLKLALYISMFPQLIAGPIVRYTDIETSLSVRPNTLSQFTSGVEIFIIGLAKKAILANLLGETADTIMQDNFMIISCAQAWIGILCYTLQIYYDFCGYSEMAIGLGRMFGFEFKKNFDYPYISRSITEFWRRWHISLSQWFRDYLYIPLGGNRRGNVYVNLFIVFLATGIWHGADWSFLFWGIWHGIFILIERIMKKRSIRIPVPKTLAPILGWFYTMLVVISGWILFYTTSTIKTLEYVKLMFGLERREFIGFDTSWYLNGRTLTVFVAAIVCCLPWKQILEKRIPKICGLWEHPAFVLAKRIVLLFFMFICFLLIVNSSYNPFIYFRF